MRLMSVSLRAAFVLSDRVRGVAARLQWPAAPLSQLEIPLPHGRIGREGSRGAGPNRVALLDHDVAVGDAGERVEMLVDQEDRLALGLETREASPDLRADQRRETLGRLVQDGEFRNGHQAAAQCVPLLVAAPE